MCLSRIWEVVQRYTTFAGEIEFTTQFLLWLGTAGTILVTLQFPLLDQQLVDTSQSRALVGAGILLALGILFYGIWSAGRYTTEDEFHTYQGTLAIGGFFLGFSTLGILLIHGGFSIIFKGILLLPSILLELGLGGFAIAMTSVYLTLRSLHDLRSRYPSIDTIQTAFQEETNRALRNIDTEIDEIGYIERPETSRVLNRLKEFENVIVTGEGGVGKSGVLASVVDAWDAQVLFLDASAHSPIENVRDLAGRLNLHEVDRPIRRLTISQPLLLIVDQLDDIGSPADQVFSDIIRTTATNENVAIAFACRSYDLDNRPAYESLREPFSTKRPVGLLDTSTTADYIRTLTGTKPSDELVELGRKIEHLDIIAELAGEGTDFSDIGGEVSLWERYRELLEHENQDDDEARRGGIVVERAVEYAREAIEDPSDSVNIFSVGVDHDWADQRLLNRRVIIQASDRAGDRKHRFRHLGFQRYLYAWDAVQENTPIGEVSSVLDERRGKDIFRFMFILYIRALGEDINRMEDIPEGSDASETTQDFIQELLDEEDGLGDYAAKTILDEVKTWDATVNDELTDAVLEKLEERPVLQRQFFSNPADPSWARALHERGEFEDPPDVFLTYLSNLAPEHPNLVADILTSIETDDRHSLAQVVAVIQNLPMDKAAELVEFVRETLTESGPDAHSLQSVELMQDLAEAGETEAALALLDRLLQSRGPDQGEPNTVQSVADLYSLKTALDNILESLVEAEGEQCIDCLTIRMREAVEVEAEVKNRDIETVAGPISSTIGGADYEETSYTNFKSLLIGTLLEALELWIELDPTETTRNDTIEEYLENITIFHRIGLHVLNQYKDHYPELVRRELLEEENYTELWIKEDFLRLLRDAYTTLPEPAQERVLNIITDVPVRDTIEEGARQRSDEVDESAADLASGAVERWVRDRLWILRDHLPEEERSQLDDLVDEYGEPDDVYSFGSTRGGFVSQESPLSFEELEQRSPEEVIEYCIKEPFETSDWEETESGDLQEISPRGLAESVAPVILNNLSRYQALIPRLADASSIYTTTLLDELRERIENDPEEVDSDFEWAPFLDLSDVVASNPDQWSPAARKSVARLLQDAYNTDSLESIWALNDRVKQIVFTLTNDPDPNEEREHPPEGYAGHNNPAHVAINSVRPIAFDALLVYAGRIADHQGFNGYAEEGRSGFDSDVKNRIEDIIENASLSIRSVIGKRLRLIWVLDRELVREHLETIFPRSQSTIEKTQFSAAWDAYVAFTVPPESLFQELRMCYFHGIDLLVADENTATTGTNRGLAQHLLIAYLKDMESLTEENSLITYLYNQDDPEMARQMAWQLWRWGKDDENVRDEWEKVIQLWEWRLDQVDEAGAYASEFEWFVEWLPLVDDRISFDQVVDPLIETTPFIAHGRRGWETLETYLASHVDRHPTEVIDIYTVLMEQETRPAWIRFNETTESILEEGINADPDTASKAFDIAEEFFRNGDENAEAFLDEHT